MNLTFSLLLSLSTVLSFVIPHYRKRFPSVKVSAEEFDQLFKLVAATSASQNRTDKLIEANNKQIASNQNCIDKLLGDHARSQDWREKPFEGLASSQDRTDGQIVANNNRIEDVARSQDWFDKQMDRINRRSGFIVNALIRNMQEFFDEYLWTTCGDSWEVEQLTVRNIMFPNGTWYTTWGGIFIANGTANFT